MFGITYKNWNAVVDAYKNLYTGAKKAYLQWYPFTKVSEEQWNKLKEEEFYKKYIENGAFVLFQNALYRSENYIQKSDGSFRDASLVSPTLYIILQCIGKEIADRYVSSRQEEISVYYSGKYEKLDIRYKQEYDNFFKEINAYQDDYKYYIKTDIASFFPNINIDKLVNRIDINCNSEGVQFTQTQLQLIKELLIYSGAGRFPLIENSIASSYLATVVYLDEVDTNLNKYIKTRVNEISEFRMIRYVDDLYILMNSDLKPEEIKGVYNEVRNEYSSILKESGLALNSKKCKLGLTKEVNAELKKSLYDEYFNGEKHQIEELYLGSFEEFLQSIVNKISMESIDIEEYNNLIESCFSFEDIEFTPNEVFNYFVYEASNEVQTHNIKELVYKIIKADLNVLSLDPKRLGVLVMKTQSDRNIKAMLNELFERKRAGKWNSYDTTITIAYLVQSKFQHIDLLSILRTNCPDLFEFYSNNCRTSFINGLTGMGARRCRTLIGVIGKDWKAYYLYFMYRVEMQKNNYLAAYAFYKNYFDRVSADLDYIAKKDTNEAIKKPNYKGFYKETSFNGLYKDIKNSKSVIERAHKIRNANPLSHSSAEIIEDDSSSDKIKMIINDLDTLIRRYIFENKISEKV